LEDLEDAALRVVIATSFDIVESCEATIAAAQPWLEFMARKPERLQRAPMSSRSFARRDGVCRLLESSQSFIELRQCRSNGPKKLRTTSGASGAAIDS
jgi:hypothetical protein